MNSSQPMMLQGEPARNREIDAVRCSRLSAPLRTASTPDRPQRSSLVFHLVAPLALVAVGMLAGCAARSPHPAVAESQRELPDAKAQHLISAWQQQLGRYLKQEGDGDPAVLSRMLVLRSRDVVRPARIRFAILDVEATIPGRDGWDVEGVLIDKQRSVAQDWYIFMVGIVARTAYRPTSIADLRLVALTAQDGHYNWRTSPPDAAAVRSYRDTFANSVPVRFPADTDQFSMKVSQDRVSVQEARSRAEWSLRLESTVQHVQPTATPSLPQASLRPPRT